MHIETATASSKPAVERTEPPARMDGRTRAARMLAMIRSDLLAKLGREPDILDTEILELAASATLQIRLMQARIVTGAILGPGEIEQLRQMHAAATTALRLLGFADVPTLAGMALKQGEA